MLGARQADKGAAQEYGIPNKQYAAVAAGSLAIAALLCAAIHAGYAAVDAAEAQAAQAAAEQARIEAENEAAALEVAPARYTDMSGALAAVTELLAGHEGQVEVCVQMLDGSGRIDVDSAKGVQAASMIKLLVLAEYLDEVDSGEVSPTDVYELDEDDVVGGSGSMQADRPDTEYTLDQVAGLMISASDNVGTNVLIDRMGLADVQDKAAELGLDETKLLHRLMTDLDDDAPVNTISADDAATILAQVACGTLASQGACDRAEEFLLAQEDDEGLAEGLPSSVAFGHKTGSLDDARHDGGIVYAENPYVIVVLTQGIDYDEANDLMEAISSAVYAALA